MKLVLTNEVARIKALDNQTYKDNLGLRWQMAAATLITAALFAVMAYGMGGTDTPAAWLSGFLFGCGATASATITMSAVSFREARTSP